MKVLIACSESVPFVKVGGLGDVAGALYKYLNKKGVNTSLVLPYYKKVKEYVAQNKLKAEKVVSFNLSIKKNQEECIIYRLDFQNGRVYFIENEYFFNREGIYTKESTGIGYSDNGLRYAFFSKAVLEMIKHLDLKIDIIHANDAHTALIPAFLKTKYKTDDKLKKIKTLYSIHNIGYQFIEDFDILSNFGFENDIFYPGSPFEFWGKVNFMKLGIVFSDIINTVSETYAYEIQEHNHYGYGLEGVLKERSNALFGIVNGIDYDEWHPKKDLLIKYNFDEEDLSNKLKMKQYLQDKLNLPFDKKAPLIGFVGRLTDQKGLDIMLPILDELLKEDLRIIILGTGEERYHLQLKVYEAKYKEKLRVLLKYDNLLAHEIIAASDMFLMPSKFEPCGLTQLYSLKYATIPIVRKTGGLADTVDDFDILNKNGDGFIFENYNPNELYRAMIRALLVYGENQLWQTIMLQAMEKNFSWENTIEKYKEIYEKLLKT